jgi:hypothetical protein
LIAFLATTFWILKDLVPYKELGPDYAEKNKSNHINLMITKLIKAGYSIIPNPDVLRTTVEVLPETA